MEKELELLKKRFIELARKAEFSGKCFFTDFLNLAQVSLFSSTMKEIKYNNYELYGGFENAQRVVARLGVGEDFSIACILIKPANAKFADKLTHRDLLGAILNLGIDRGKVGDIIVKEDHYYVFCCNSIVAFIIENLSKIKHTTVVCKISEDFDQEVKQEFKSVGLLVASERIDLIIAKLFNLSRSEASNLFSKEYVFVNSMILTNNSYALKSGDIISVRGYGKFIYDGVDYVNKKDKKCVKVRKYV